MSAPRRYSKWTVERAMRAAFLAGRGLKHAEIAVDPTVQSTPGAVQVKLCRAGILSSDAVTGVSGAILLPPDLLRAYEAAGRARQMTADKVFREAMFALSRDKTLLDNVLDDGVCT
jgi:hypothetical protein